MKAGTTTNYAEIESDGTLVFSGNATVWDDLRFPVQALNPPGLISDPDVDNNDGTYLFSSTGTELLFGVAQMPHSWKLESDIYPHIHWAPIDNSTGATYWQFSYDIAKINGVFSGTYTNVYVSDEGAGATATHQLASFGAVSMTGYDTVSTVIKWRLSRLGGSGTDTYSTDARLLEFDIHYEMDTVGSRGETSK